MNVSENFAPAFELPPQEDFEDYCLGQFRAIRAQNHREIEGWKFDPQSGLYDKEIEALKGIFTSCKGYMGKEDFALVKKSAALALYAHAGQYRDSGEPYTVHLFAITKRLVQKKQDAVTIASGFTHDTIEDTRKNPTMRVTEDTLRVHIHPVVSETVASLSEYRGDVTRPKLTDIEKQLEVLYSLATNPRVAIIRIEDRLNNMETLQWKKKRSSRINTIEETKRIYIPLAKLLGMTREAQLLETLCIKQDPRENRERFDALEKEHIDLQDKFDPDAIESTFRSLFGHDVNIEAQLSGVAAMYHDEHAKSHVNINMSVTDVRKEDNPDWWRGIINIATRIVGNEEYVLEGVLGSAQSFYEETRLDLADSLHFVLVDQKTGVRFQVHLYPRDVFELELVSIDMLYLHSEKLDDPSNAFRRVAQKKQEILADKLSKARTAFVEGRAIPSFLVHALEPRLSDDMMYVWGQNDQGIELPWKIGKESTVLDYAKSIAPSKWTRVSKAIVNGEEVPVWYVLQPKDRVHLNFNSVSHYDPSWIHAFNTDREGANFVREKFMSRMRSERLNKDTLFSRICDEGRRQSTLVLPKTELPFRYGLASEIVRSELQDIVRDATANLKQHDVQRFLPELHEDESVDDLVTKFYFAVGLGIVPRSNLESIMKKASEINKKVIVIEVSFSHNLPRQLATTVEIAAALDINLVTLEGTGDGTATVRLYVRPEDEPRVMVLASKIWDSRALRALDFTSILSYPQFNREFGSEIIGP